MKQTSNRLQSPLNPGVQHAPSQVRSCPSSVGFQARDSSVARTFCPGTWLKLRVAARPVPGQNGRATKMTPGLSARLSLIHKRVVSNPHAIARILVATLVCGNLMISATGCSSNSRKERHLNRADGFFEKADYQAAAIEYMNVLRQPPEINFPLSDLVNS